VHFYALLNLVRHFHVLQFHALHIGPSFSRPAISCFAILMVRHFHVLHFQSTSTATLARPRVINVQGTVKTLEQLRFRNRQQRGIKPRFRFGSVLPKNRGFGTDFDNRNNTSGGWARLVGGLSR